MKVSCDTRKLKRFCNGRSMDRIVEFSDDVLCEILSRLPAKSVCRSKCCSKSFLNITKAMDFTKKQSQNSLLRDDSCFFIQNFFNRSQTSNTEIHTLLPSSSSAIGIPSKFLDFVDEKLVMILASSNGLVLCKIQAITNSPMQLFICNPITGSCSFIPSPIQRGFEKDRRVIFSFECNIKDEDYTLYALERDGNFQSWSLVCKMYIPKEGLWKEIGTRFLLGNKHMATNQLPVFYKGALHFIISEIANHEEWFYLASYNVESGALLYLASYNVESGSLRTFEAPRRARDGEGPVFIEYFGQPHREDVRTFKIKWLDFEDARIFKWGKVGSKEESICWVKLYDYTHFTVWILSDNESSSGVWSWSIILSSVGLEKLGLNEKNSSVRGFTLMNGHSLVFATNRNGVYDYDLSGKRKPRLTKVCDHKLTINYLDGTIISYSDTFRSCGIDSKTL